MKISRILLVLATFLGSVGAAGQLNQVYPEVYAVDAIPGYTTYRIFAELNTPSDYLTAVFAAEEAVLSIGSSSNTIWNSLAGAVTGDALALGFCMFVPDLCYDSFVTIGWYGDQDFEGNTIACGQATTTISSLPSPSVISDSFGPEIADNLEMSDGAWFSANVDGCNDNGLGIGPDNRVLLCQITIPSEDNLEYEINIQVFLDGDGANSAMYFANSETMLAGGIDGSNMGLAWPMGNCLDEAACNFNTNPGSTENGDLCTYQCYGCTDSIACNYDESSTIDDGSCTTDCPGCTDETAENYDPSANNNNGTCIYAGCMDTTACNYDSQATIDNGSCEFSCVGCVDTTACNYDSTATIDDGSCIAFCDGCTDQEANNYDANATNDDGSCLYIDDYFLSIEPYFVHDVPLDVDLTGYTTYRMYVNMVNGTDEVSAVLGLTDQELNITSTDGFWQSEFGALLGSEITEGFFAFFPSLEYDSFVTIGMENSSVQGTLTAFDAPGNTWMTNFELGENIEISDNIGGSWFTISPEINGVAGDDLKVLIGQFTTTGSIEACIHTQIFPLGAQENSILLELCANSGPIQGCTNSVSCNYNPNAEEDNGSCTDTCPGCMDSTASNYQENATEENGYCLYDGCTDPDASNYDSNATNMDWSCIYPGCMDPLAFNYDFFANEDDGSCDYDCDGTIVYLDMTDSFGDGWNGATWVVADEMGNVIFSGSLDDAPAGNFADSGSDLMCLFDGCYTFTAGGGTFDSEIGWTLTGTEGGDISGIAPSTTAFQIGTSICIMGCTDIAASNYNSEATLMDGTCLYPGCNTEWAENYDSTANVDDGSCLFDISGYVFYDGNMNGEYDNAGYDFGLAYQLLTLEPGGLLVITDEDGYYSFGVQPSDTYTVTADENVNFPIATTPSSYAIDNDELISTPSFDFGMADDDAFFAICVDLYPMAWGYPCNGIAVNHNVCFRNMGTETIDGIVQIDYDELFVGYEEVTPIDSVIGNSIYMSYENLLPGEMFFYNVKLITPDFTAMGEFLSTTAYVSALDGDDILAFGEQTLEMEVTCSWDPNDKMVFPPGYADPHYILGDQELDYVVRFQNTGNAFAETVLIRDTIAGELDLNSFALMANSHSVMTTINQETREVQFLFENIMLPDSGFSEPESHGLISYTIKPLEGLAAETQFTNTAHIFFDANPAIITNSTWNTIYECGAEGDFTVNSEELCEGDELIAESTHSYVDTFSWELDGDLVSVEAAFAVVFTDAGQYELYFVGENPLCSTPGSITINVNSVPDAIITHDGAILTATEGSTWQWHFNGNEIAGANNQSYTITEIGVFTVEVFTEAGCSAISEGVTVTSVDEFISQVALLFPNPMTTSSTLMLSVGTYTVTITDSAGRTVRSFENINGGTHTIDREGLASGVYQLHVATKDQPHAQSMQLIVQ
ncbi:MAG: putative repeat protein (TIGR01451 family) [Litorivivens sp.]|jgi:uncharacterized repeat protein (TIGR01451 family)